MKPVRTLALCFALPLTLASGSGCFALFSLDEYGPGGDAGAGGGDAGAKDTGSSVTPEAAPPVDLRPTKRVFLTTTTSSGNLNGLAGADERCQLLATGAGLSGNFKAWLTVDESNPRARFFPVLPDGGGLPDVRVIDTANRTVMQSWASYFATKRLLVPIEHNERGVKLTPSDAGNNFDLQLCGGAPVIPVWTNTLADGTTASNQEDCQNFQDNGGGTQIGIVATDERWTAACRVPCSARAHLYCVEQ